jgi:hypothetical protein
MVVTLAACAAAIGPTSGCYGATEIRLALTTNAPCPNGRLETEIYTGGRGTNDFGTVSVATVQACGPDLGTLSIVPSGTRDDQFDLEVVSGVGVSIAACRPESLGQVDPTKAPDRSTGCIVARRRVSFRPHQSLSLPIKLDSSCIGVPCGLDATCDLGVCTPTADCTDLGCPRERAEVGVDAGPVADAAVDAATDASVDGPIDGGPVTGKCGPVAEIVVDKQAIQGPLTMDGENFVYANIPTVLGAEVRRVPRVGGPATTVQAVPYLVTATASGGALAWGVDASGQLAFTRRVPGQADRVYAPVPYMPSYLATAIAGSYVVGLANSLNAAGGAHAFALADIPKFEPTSAAGPMGEIVVDDENHFYGVAGSQVVMHYRVDGSGVPVQVGRIANGGTPMGDIAIAQHIVFVALAGPRSGIHRIDRAAIADPYSGGAWLATTALPQSLESDGTSLYYLTGTTLSRSSIVASGPSPVDLAQTGTDADRLRVDDTCVYWVEGKGKRIMKRLK